MTGQILPSTQGIVAGSWLGAIGYMTLLDQIGSCFKPRSHATIAESRAICRALSYFSSLSRPEQLALYALRCAFAHDYSLYNIHKDPLLTHRFVTNAALTGPVVILPTAQWNGIYSNFQSGTQTKINLRAFGDLIEDIARQVVQLAAQNDLEIILPNGSDELVVRYGIARTSPPLPPAAGMPTTSP